MTLSHELGHQECGHVGDLSTYRTCRGRCEVEAASVAYVVAASVGLDAAGYTFAYVAGWTGGEPALVRQAAETVTTAGRTILGRLDPTNIPTAVGSRAWPRRRLTVPGGWSPPAPRRTSSVWPRGRPTMTQVATTPLAREPGSRHSGGDSRLYFRFPKVGGALSVVSNLGPIKLSAENP